MWYSIDMEKLSKKEVFKLLKNKGTKTFKELSSITGYHEKSLNRIATEIKNGRYHEMHGNCGRKPYNKISEKEKESLRSLYYKNTYLTKKEFHQFLCLKGYHYSYAFVAKLIVKEKKKKTRKQVIDILHVSRKMILENTLQYRNKRYLVKTESPIPHHECVVLFVKRETFEPLYIEYKKKRYQLLYQKQVYSKCGNTKY